MKELRERKPLVYSRGGQGTDFENQPLLLCDSVLPRSRDKPKIVAIARFAICSFELFMKSFPLSVQTTALNPSPSLARALGWGTRRLLTFQAIQIRQILFTSVERSFPVKAYEQLESSLCTEKLITVCHQSVELEKLIFLHTDIGEMWYFYS